MNVRASLVERKGSYTILRVLICRTFCAVCGERNDFLDE